MNKAFRYFFSVIVIATLLLGSMAMTPAARSEAVVHLKSGSFIPAQRTAALGSQKYYIVQFAGPVQQAWKDALTAEGAELLDYLPDFAFKVRMNPAIASRVAALNFVSAVTAFRPEFKFSSSLTRDSATRLYRVRIERGADFTLVRDLIAQTGAQTIDLPNLVASDAQPNVLIVAANSALLNALAQVDDVASISEFKMYQTFSAPAASKPNDYAVNNIIGAATAHARGYNGSTQIVAVADTGLGGGTPTTAHRDINGRVLAIYNWPGVSDNCWTISDDGAVDVDSGHGTHTAGSVLSAGAPNGIGKGAAPAAQLVFQAVENWATMKGICALYYSNGYYLTGLPADLNQLYQQAYNAGARVHSNSWGSAAAGDYTTESAQSDTFMWNNRDMLITFSAGNEGVDANSDGVIDNDSIGSPATAKNVLTVGASENQRSDGYPCDTSLSYTTCASQGGVNNIFTWGAAWPSDYPANPIRDDVSANNAGQMAAFSSRGPTDDNRIKPDVVAPGSWILSTYSDMYQQGYDASPNPRNNAWQYDGYGFPYDRYYKYLSGTSMSNPLAAGGAAVVKDYYNKAYGINASAALVKATLINSAVDMLDENNDGVNDNDYPIPNVHEGWGRINLDAATDGTIQFVDEGTGLSTGGSASFQVTSTGGPLKVTLVWTDYPSTDTAAINLVNDLDLTVSGPSGTFRGNVFSAGWSVSGGTADRRNNVENVYIQNPAAGTYTITVSAYNIPNGPQKFALVVDGGTFASGPTPTPAPTNTPTNTPAPTNTPSPTSTPAPVTSTGYLSPSANAAVTSGSGDNNGYEGSPANAYANDSLFASDINSGSGTSTSYTSTQKDRHIFYNYGFNIPSGATITGIQVRVDARADRASGTRQIYVQLSWDGGVSWTTALSTANLSTSEVTYILGGATNTWGRTWSASDFTNANFRVRVIDVSSNTARDFYLDWIAVNVTYQP